MSAERSEPYASQRRRLSLQLEAIEQRKLVALLTQWIDPETTSWTAVENRPRSALAGMFQRMRGVKPGLPDLLVTYRGRVVWLELKSPVGTTSRAQRQMRLELLAGGAQWFLCRSARSAMTALYRSGVKFRTRGGQRWKPPALPDWEQPVDDPSRPHPAHPAVTAQRREARRRQRAAQRARLAAHEARAAILGTRDHQPAASDARP